MKLVFNKRNGTVVMFPDSEWLGAAVEARGFEPHSAQWYFIYGPAHDKTYKIACAPSEDSDQPGHPPSLIRVFAVRMKKAWVLSYPLSAQRRP